MQILNPDLLILLYNISKSNLAMFLPYLILMNYLNLLIHFYNIFGQTFTFLILLFLINKFSSLFLQVCRFSQQPKSPFLAI